MRILRQVTVVAALAVAATTAAVVPAVASTASAGASRAAADSSFGALVCRGYDGTACADLQNGTTSQGQPIFLWNRNAPGVGTHIDWTFVQAGTVQAQIDPHPFADGSGLNTSYNGDPYYQIKYTDNPYWCMGTQTGGSGSIVLEPCSSGNYWVVAEPYSTTSTLIDVYQSNWWYANNGVGIPEYLNNSTTTDGSPLFADSSVEYWWGFLPAE